MEYIIFSKVFHITTNLYLLWNIGMVLNKLIKNIEIILLIIEPLYKFKLKNRI